MDELKDDFEKFHDEIILENAQLKAKVEALEEFVKSSVFLSFDTSNYNQLLKEYLLKELNNFDELSRRKQVYNSRSVADLHRDYILNLRQQIEKLK